MKLRTRWMTRVTLTGLTLACTPQAHAAVSADEAKALGTTLTKVGAEQAGNKDGTIPAYTGGLTTPPAGYAKGNGLLADPFADDKVLYSVDAKNLAQYADQLTQGTQALMKRYATFRADVYPTHRSVAFPQYVLDNTVGCATTANTANEGLSIQGCLAGYPFPIPQSGAEAMWNHLVRYNGEAYKLKFRSFNVNAGHATLSAEGTGTQQYPYWAPAKAGADTFLRLKVAYSGPARRAGEQILVLDPLSYADAGRRAWQYLPGQRRVKLAPDISFDTPNPGTAGATTYDDTFLFMGSLERYDFKLVGKKEMLVPYNAYKLMFGTAQDDLLKPDHLNPAAVRWEKHRVWVVEATLRPGKRHVYGKRTFYLDEDSWAVLGSDEYDARGELYRVGLAYETPRYDVLAPYSDTYSHYDLISGIYTLVVWPGATDGLHTMAPLNDKEWTADAIAGSGIR